MDFTQFFENSMSQEEDKNVKATLKKLPKAHQALLKGFKIKFISGNTLKGDKEHVGYMLTSPKEIVIASPWNYPREFTFLHEVGHLVWAQFVDEGLQKEWQKVVDSTKERQHQGYEELFCMAYASHFAKNKISIHDHETWHSFIHKLCYGKGK